GHSTFAPTYTVSASGFKNLNAFAAGPNSRAELTTGPTGADSAVGTPTYSSLLGPNNSYALTASNFRAVSISAGGGVPGQSVNLTTAATGIDTFSRGPGNNRVDASITGAGGTYTVSVVGFQKVTAYAGSNQSVANFTTTSNNDPDTSDYFSGTGAGA